MQWPSLPSQPNRTSPVGTPRCSPTPTDTGQSKVRGKPCYFGKREDDPQGEGTLKAWAEQKDELLAGVSQTQVKGKGDFGLPLHKLVNDDLNAKRRLRDAGKFTARTLCNDAGLAYER